MMRLFFIRFTLISLLTIGTSVTAGTYLSATEVKNLISGNTTESIGAKSAVVVIKYHDPNGTYRGVRDGTRDTGTWRVKENGELCITREGEDNCGFLQKSGSEYKKYKVRGAMKVIHIATIRKIMPGNPNGY